MKIRSVPRLLRRNSAAVEHAKELLERAAYESLTGENWDLFLRRENDQEQLAREKTGHGEWVFIVSALKGRNGIWSTTCTECKEVFVHCVRTRRIRTAIMIRKNLEQNILFRN
jgi:hypothetical protein